jgi:hypothetical protein
MESERSVPNRAYSGRITRNPEVDQKSGSGQCPILSGLLQWKAAGQLFSSDEAAASCGSLLRSENGSHFMCLRDCSFSRQISSINSVSTTMRCLNVTVHGFV